ncbi:uncharacterized protein [Pocillopora verrucosa]|uniref:uncharacterized protein n=1 Tax=Pocillopora verrucosa TaxID=203993 RepID=UPI00333EFF1B
MIFCVRVVLEASHHCKATQNRRCWSNRFQALCDRLCLYQERSSKLKTSFREEAQQTLAKRKVERLKRAVISHRQPKEHVFNILCHAVNVCDDATYFSRKSMKTFK